MYAVENIMAKEEIAHCELFLLLPQCFQKSSAAEVSESVYMWDRDKLYRLENLNTDLNSEQFILLLQCFEKSFATEA